MTTGSDHVPSRHAHCCGSEACARSTEAGISRRQFLTASGIALSTLAMSGLAWQSALAADLAAQPAPLRRPLVVKPILAYETPTRRPQTSWRSWGGIQTEQDAQAELTRIQGELDKLKAAADFPITFLPITPAKEPSAMLKADDFAQADAILLYAAGGPQGILQAAVDSGKQTIFFLRHRSGPVSLWYEIISPRFLHQHKDQLSDKLAAKGVDNADVVVDSMEEVSWRLRALCGLKNALGTRILAIGGPAGWETPNAPDLARAKWKLDIQTITYQQLAPLLAAALADKKATTLAAQRAADYLKDPHVTLETEKSYVENAFLLEQVFKTLMAQANAHAITVNACMGSIMPISKTTACLSLSLLNDAGYLAFCESDFVVIPSGILLSTIAGKPNFLNDPTYPHDGVITLAHCTAPRRLDGKNLEPARIVTHFESDYGAAPKVEMRKGQLVTNVIPDFASNRYVGFLGEIVDSPFLPICRSQIDVAYKVPDAAIATNMPGFHWETIYGDYLKETGYALKKIPIGWTCLG